MLALSNSFLVVIESPADGTRPNRTTSGNRFTLGASNVEGAYTQILNGATAWPAGAGDGWGILIHFTDTNISAGNGACLATIGIDLAGGTSYTEWINDLVCGPAAGWTSGAPYSYYFPIRIPNGASLAVKAQSANATPPATSGCTIQVFCEPTRPELLRVGTFVQTFGANVAASNGSTAITSGTVSEGAYSASIATLDKPIWWFEFGLACAAAAMTSNLISVDVAIGDAGNKRRIIDDVLVRSAAAEAMQKHPSFAFAEGAIGDNLYMRCQVGDNADPGNVSGIVYGVGG